MRHPPSDQAGSGSRRQLPATRRAPSLARAFVRAVLAERALSTASTGPVADRLADNAVLLTSELVTNAVMHAGTEIGVVCHPETGRPPAAAPDAGPEVPPDPGGVAGGLSGVRVEVVDRQPSARVPGTASGTRPGRGLGLQVVSTLADAWGVTYRRTEKAVWFRVTATGQPPPRAGHLAEALHRELEVAPAAPPAAAPGRSRAGGLPDRGDAFLAEASELLSGQLDEDMIAALAGQLLVPRLADWCAVWLTTEGAGMRLSRVWHVDERRVDALRADLEPDPPAPDLRTAGTPWPWPESEAERGTGGAALEFSLVSAGACQGSLVIGRAGPAEITDHAARTVEDVARRVAQALVTARQYTRQATINRALQRRQLPANLASLPGVESAIVYEPHGRGLTVGGDFYDLFPAGHGCWCFLLGDVQGKDPEAMAVTGLTRHLVRLLAREGHTVPSVLGWLNAMMAEDTAEAMSVGEGAQLRLLSMVYGELAPDRDGGGARCTLASAGHPLPLRLSADGEVTSVVRPQMLLGIAGGTTFDADTFRLDPGDTLLCVTDGVTERRNGHRQLDDDEGLVDVLRGCVGLGAVAVAERVRQATHDFGPEPVEDDLAILVLQATPAPR